MQNLKWHHQGANAKKERLVKTSWRFIPQVFWPFVQIIRFLRTVMFLNLRTEQFEWLSNEEALDSLTCILIMMEQYWKWAVNEDILPKWMLMKVDGLSTWIWTPIITALKNVFDILNIQRSRFKVNSPMRWKWTVFTRTRRSFASKWAIIDKSKRSSKPTRFAFCDCLPIDFSF